MSLFVLLFVALILIALAVWAVPQLLAAIGVPANVARAEAAMRRVRAALLAFLLAAAAVTATGWTPACTAFERWSIEWIALGCWYGEPDPPPCANCA